jgi:hypothetical protein
MIYLQKAIIKTRMKAKNHLPATDLLASLASTMRFKPLADLVPKGRCFATARNDVGNGFHCDRCLLFLGSPVIDQ